MTEEFIERKIVTGFIVSTEFIQQIRSSWNSRLIESSTAQLLISWCLDYFDKYNIAPSKNIQNIYTEKLRQGVDKEKAEWIEMILESLSEEYEREQFNVSYLLDQTKSYFQERHLKLYIEDISFELNQGNTLDAERLALNYNPVSKEQGNVIDPFDTSVRSKIKQAFAERKKPLIRFPKVLGQFWNQELIRGGFVALMGREKIGKTFLLIELAMRAIKSGCNVAFFQAGDMTELEQLRRLAIYLAERSDQARYCSGTYIPVLDCLLNQTDKCDEDIREGNDEIFKDKKEINWNNLMNAVKQKPDHEVCHNCDKIQGSPWLQWQKETQVLTWPQAYKYLRRFKKKYKKQFLLSSHANETLSIAEMKSHLSIWEKQKGFVPDVIIIDYADILAPDPDFSRQDFRQQQNKIWQRLRNLSQEKHCLVLTATQIKAQGYSKDLLTMSDFSEDKRKFSHITAMYGLNQTVEEKRIGLMRINELAVREAEFDSFRPVTILQRLQIGKPFLGSYR